jgi:hypothetical protein
MSDDPRSVWRALGNNHDAMFKFYREQPATTQRDLLHALSDNAEAALPLLARLALEIGLLPEQLSGLMWQGMTHDPRFEPLWLMLWRDMGATPESVLQGLLVSGATSRTLGVAESMLRDAEGEAREQLELFVFQLRQRPLVAPVPGPLDMLAQAEPIWSWSQQWAALRLQDTEAKGEGLAAVVSLRQRLAEPRARRMLGWVAERLQQSAPVWQDALEACWEVMPELDPSVLWARQQHLWSQGHPLRQLRPSFARALAARQDGSRAAALMGLPWSIDALMPHIAQEGLRAAEYGWVVAPGLSEPAVGAQLHRLIESTHVSASGLMLSRSLAGVRQAAQWPRASWLALTRRDEPQVQVELCGLIERLALSEGKAWLELLVSESPDVKVAGRAMRALVVVGDARSAGIVQTRGTHTPALSDIAAQVRRALLGGEAALKQARGQLTLAVEGERGGLELMGGAAVGALTMDGASDDESPRAVAIREPWERLASGPREVTDVVATVHLCWRSPRELVWWLMAVCVWLPLAGAALLLAELVSADATIGQVLNVYLLCAPLLGCLAILRMLWTDDRVQSVLSSGAPVMGTLREDAARGWIAELTDDEGAAIAVSVSARQRVGLAAGRYPLLFMREGGATVVEVVRALEVGAGGALVPAAGLRVGPRALLWWLMVVWGAFIGFALSRGW